MRVEYRPTVAEDVALLADGSPPPLRIRAITVVIDGVVMGFGGIGYRPDGMLVAFVHARPQAKDYPVAFHRAGLMAIEMMRRHDLAPVYAQAQADNPAAERWLLRLGFHRVVAGGHTAFVWEDSRDG